MLTNSNRNNRNKHHIKWQLLVVDILFFPLSILFKYNTQNVFWWKIQAYLYLQKWTVKSITLSALTQLFIPKTLLPHVIVL